MLKRYEQLQDHLSGLESMEFDELSLAPSHNRRIDRVIEDLEVFESVTKELQKDVRLISDVRALFDAVVDRFLSTTSRLGAWAEIVANPQFDSAAG